VLARPRRLRAAAAVVAAASVLVLAASTAQAHRGPPSRYYHRCTSRIGGGSDWVTFQGRMYAHPNQITQFWTRIVPALPFGWSGSWRINGSPFHPAIIIPPSRSHWYFSPAIILGSRGTYTWRVDVRPNPGSFNNYRLDIYAPYRCS
jgi:hypothetical protein